ncbi:MAG: 1-deoxy-D-xylulose-5-phosphate synthase [Alphaproteobacteria bacterium]|nr:1-deoxy-D-xylulose-5-phosphate synthase [Rickettsiales bacterium]
MNEYTSLEDLKKMNNLEIFTLCEWLRKTIIENTLRNGGHLGASLGVVELTVALHYVFESPKDKLVWDIGHQAYAHKIITDRKDKFSSMRSENGISGFCDKKESKHDIFNAGHSSTSIAAVLGMAVSEDILNKRKGEIIAIIGDGSLSAGLALESISNAGVLKKRAIIILNDNDTSISQSIGGVREHLVSLKQNGKILLEEDLKEAVQNAFSGKKSNGNIFTNNGCGYIGIVDGYNFDTMVKLFTLIKQSTFNGALVVHIKTEKGKGHEPAKRALDKMHSVSPISLNAKKIEKFTYSTCFAKSIEAEMCRDESVICVSAAMTIGTGLYLVEKKFPDRVFDVGITEQFAVTFSAGMANANAKPYCCIYSTFLQRGYDQVIHDVAVQKLPVRFIIDRAGYVGYDGATHNGAFDIAYLRILPDFIIMSPSTGKDLMRMIKTSSEINDAPCAIRYARGQDADDAVDVDYQSILPIPIGTSNTLQDGKDCCIIAVGNTVKVALDAAGILLREHFIHSTVIDARFIKPIDKNMLIQMSNKHTIIVTVEDGSIGGFGSIVVEELVKINYKGKIVTLCHPDNFLPHASTSLLHRWAGIEADSIVATIDKLIREG